MSLGLGKVKQDSPMVTLIYLILPWTLVNAIRPGVSKPPNCYCHTESYGASIAFNDRAYGRNEIITQCAADVLNVFSVLLLFTATNLKYITQ